MELNEKQIDTIKLVLDLFGQEEKKNTGVHNISGGYAYADMFDNDDLYIDIELNWGVKSDCTDNPHTEQFKLSIENIDDDTMSLLDKVHSID